MAFTELAKRIAAYRQTKWDGWGTWCAKCGTPLAGKKVEVTQRTPSDKGGDWEADNCVVLCADCFAKIGDHKERLTDAEIPYYHQYPDLWHGNSEYVREHGQTSSGVKF